MRLATIEKAGRIGIAAFETDDECRALFHGDPSFPGDLSQVLARGPEGLVLCRDRLASAERLSAFDIRYLPPVPRPGKIVCIGMNYLGHIKEVGAEIPGYPGIFARFATSLVGHNMPIVCPSVSEQLDFEGELAVIIGKAGRYIAVNDALDYVAGYSVFNDASLRDYQLRTPQWMAGKNFDATGAFGPYLVTPDEVPAGADGLALHTTLNGDVVQSGDTGDLVFNVATLISILSEFMTLEPCDVIVTGTPSGVGIARKPQLWMKPGDVCTVEIEGIGRLSNRIAAE
jgi:acylpyruvate hydrolase